MCYIKKTKKQKNKLSKKKIIASEIFKENKKLYSLSSQSVFLFFAYFFSLKKNIFKK